MCDSNMIQEKRTTTLRPNSTNTGTTTTTTNFGITTTPDEDGTERPPRPTGISLRQQQMAH